MIELTPSVIFVCMISARASRSFTGLVRSRKSLARCASCILSCLLSPCPKYLPPRGNKKGRYGPSTSDNIGWIDLQRIMAREGLGQIAGGVLGKGTTMKLCEKLRRLKSAIFPQGGHHRFDDGVYFPYFEYIAFGENSTQLRANGRNVRVRYTLAMSCNARQIFSRELFEQSYHLGRHSLQSNTRYASIMHVMQWLSLGMVPRNLINSANSQPCGDLPAKRHSWRTGKWPPTMPASQELLPVVSTRGDGPFFVHGFGFLPFGGSTPSASRLLRRMLARSFTFSFGRGAGFGAGLPVRFDSISCRSASS